MNKTINFKYDVDYDYSTQENCDDECKTGYCRCSTIEDARVERPLLNDIVNTIIKEIEIESTDINKYIVSRLLSFNKVFNSENWNIDITDGYYGQEVESIEFSNIDLVLNKFQELSSLTDIEKIKAVLLLEYNHIIDRIERCPYVFVKKIPVSNIKIGNTKHANQVQVDARIYTHYDIPAGIVYLENGHYTLIDGYHRRKAMLENYQTMAKYIVFTTDDIIKNLNILNLY